MLTDPFETLGLQPRFDLARETLEQRHRSLSAALHPDRYVGRPASERRLALDRAIAVNTAMRLLRDPVTRAESLMRRGGVAIGETREPQASPALLMEMMEVREELAEIHQAKDLDQLAAMTERMQSRKGDVLDKLRQGFAHANGDVDELNKLLGLLGELRYLHRFFEELAAIEEDLMT